MNPRTILLSVLFVFTLINMIQVFAITENFLVLPNQQKTFDIIINENQKVFFQIFVEGGENDIHLKIIDSNSNFVYFNGIIRETKSSSDYPSPIFEAYKSEISNNDTAPKNLTFIFDNTLTSSKNVDFIYVVTETGKIFDQPEFQSWIYSLVIIVTVIVIVITAIVIVIKKLKREINKN